MEGLPGGGGEGGDACGGALSGEEDKLAGEGDCTMEVEARDEATEC